MRRPTPRPQDLNRERPGLRWPRRPAIGGPRRVGFFIAGLLFALALAAGWVAWRASAKGLGPRAWIGSLLGRPAATAGLRLAVQSPYENVRPGVTYVGDAACARCHGEISEVYRGHPMGRSLGRVDAAEVPGLESSSPPSFTAQGLEYAIERRGDRIFHKEIRRDADGRVVCLNEAEARYVIGSGEQALAFLLERGDGYLFESPITWYSRKGKWDLSPGYEADNPHFERFVKPACLFCHSNQFDHVEGTENRYRQPVFRGHAIGCERCHGPGELHVRKPERPSGELPNIVNPARLEPVLREAVCQQCHLQGDIRVVRAGRKLTDFRPGLPLSSIESVFVKVAADGKTRFFGQVEQMHESRCFRESRGKMGCISCHDPHELPDPREKAAYYRERCMSCHSEKGCSLPAPQRISEGRDDRCIDCHMPRSANEQVPHTATTLHLIPRFKDRPAPATEARRSPGGRDAPLIHFHQGQLEAGERSAAERDLGIALATMNRALPGTSAAAAGRMALPLLDASLAADPADGPAWAAKGTALWLLARREESLAAFRTALGLAPENEEILIAAGTRAAQMKRGEEALAAFSKAVAINPWRADYREVLALAHSQSRRWDAAIEASRAATRLNPWNHEARLLLVRCLLGARRLPEARAEFQALLDLDPPGRDELKAWFDGTVSRSAGR